MGKLLFFLVSIFISSVTFASQYPADYCRQGMSEKVEGSVAIAYVGGGCSSSGRYFIGYKKDGILSKNYDSIDHLDLIITTRCVHSQDSNISVNQVMTYRVNKEYHGAGFMIELKEDQMPYCLQGFNRVGERELAFSDGMNRWDSQMGRNYQLGDINRARYTYLSQKIGGCGYSICFDIYDNFINSLKNN